MIHGTLAPDSPLVQKISKHHFFQGIKNSFHLVTQMANSYKDRRAIARKFQLNSNNSKTAQNIDLKFSAFVHHMSGLNLHKNFSHCSISESAPSSMQKL